MIKIISTCVLLAASLLISGCSSSLMLTSSQLDQNVIVDGYKNEWRDSLHNVGHERLSIGFSNDSENLFLCLTTPNQSKIRSILNRGLIIWMEPESGRKIGIRFPIIKDSKRNYDFPVTKRADDIDNFLSMIRKRIREQDVINIVNEEGRSLTAYPVNGPTPFNAALGFAKGVLVYELKVPLAENRTADLFLNAFSGERVRINIETEEIDKPQNMGRDRKGGRNSGGMSGGRGGGKRQPGKGDRPDPSDGDINLSVDLLLL